MRDDYPGDDSDPGDPGDPGDDTSIRPIPHPTRYLGSPWLTLALVLAILAILWWWGSH